MGNYTDEDIKQGSSYVYRLSVITNIGQQLNLINKSASTEIANPLMNCAKLNNVYRKAGHNTYQHNIPLFMTLFFTRVLELDAHLPFPPTVAPNDWFVAHTNNTFLFGNDNNCGNGDKNFSVCLDDLVNWHNQNLNHDPITVFIDIYAWIPTTHTPAIFDALLIQKFGFNNIYKPKDLIGNSFGDMRIAAQQNNWPSMGDLTGKFIFVLTGDGSKVSEYIANRSTDAVAFSAAKVENDFDVLFLPTIWPDAKNDIVFYNMQQFCKAPWPLSYFCSNDANFNTGYTTANLGYINRTYGIGTSGQPGDYSPSEYTHALNFNMHNVAVYNIGNTFNLENGIQWMPGVTYPGLVNDHIYSNYQNVTQAATQNIVATDLIVEPGAHYRMIAGNSIDLQTNVDIKEGSDVDIRIDDCTNVGSYNLRQSAGEQLTQEEIEALMHELDKDLYGYTPEDEKEIVNLSIYPNPTNNIVNISYTNFLLNNAIFTLYDITGRLVKTENYVPQNEGNQNFSLNINELKAGTYFYTLQVGEQSYNGKVVKME
ncbi:MAG: hypothetical protein A3K10_08825 [Bacteroidetes bacterium RIFCSPLOWO2_12_FULL_31_6]|nr:MAG: hypothetical protein A3K10_08825 [Bacteroidetes bacterium RIFCSPLOWO2_12_FULL_31_6]